jgi:hypothetical protein
MEIIFQTAPEVIVASNRFVNVPTIIQYDETPLLQVVKATEAGYTSRFHVYNQNGEKIAVVDGSQIYLTNNGKKVKLVARHYPGVTAFELEGKTIMELRRTEAAALKTDAELFAPGGILLKAADHSISQLAFAGSDPMVVSNQSSVVMMSGNTIRDVSIGILFHKGGGFTIGARGTRR